MVELIRHSYRYYPYELELARREAQTILPQASLSEIENGFKLGGRFDSKAVERLVYFAGTAKSDGYSPTMQSRLERVNGNGVNRQSTRYSAHGIHEYKGKFNPQIVRAILNIMDVPKGSRILDPFCGSGTSLLECSHVGMRAIGTDINPLAIFIANAKLEAVRLPIDNLKSALVASIKRQKTAKISRSVEDEMRFNYLKSWFDPAVLEDIERLRVSILSGEKSCIRPLLTVASNLLRDYSQQDPNDLRIRRRRSPLPAMKFVEAFAASAESFLSKLQDAQSIVRASARGSKALLFDSRYVTRTQLGAQQFDCALTSPPYATALPYIDTQRLSLVWLGLIQPSEILPLEARLIGSREVRGESKKTLLAALMANSAGLRSSQARYCRNLQDALGPGDGFRRTAVPLLLYRYFTGMDKVFRSVRSHMKLGAPFVLIVGSNHTTLGGTRFEIDTAQHLAEIASECGWRHSETIPLQTYQRYGYHMINAVANEGMIILRAA